MKKNNNIGIACFLLNFFTIPGIGSIVAKRKEGKTQLLLAIIAIPLCLILIGFVIWAIVWMWGVMSGINEIQEEE